jgi:hypothetical protein
MSTRANYPWQRYWVRQGENPVMDNGYFVEPTSDKLRWYSPDSNGATLLTLKDVPCLVLLGDVSNSGKMVTCRAIQSIRTGCNTAWSRSFGKGVLGRKDSVGQASRLSLTLNERLEARVSKAGGRAPKGKGSFQMETGATPVLHRWSHSRRDFNCIVPA